jgi:hypothetical protein
MKLKRIITQFLVTFSVCVFVAINPVVNFASAHPIFQDATGAGKKSKKNKPEAKSKKNKAAQSETESSGAGNRTPSSANTNSNEPGNSNKSDGPFVERRGQLKKRADAALNNSQHALDDLKDPKLAKDFEGLSAEVQDFKGSLNEAKDEKDLEPLEAKLFNIEEHSRRIIETSHSLGTENSSNSLSIISLLLTLIVIGALAYLFSRFRARLNQIETEQEKMARSIINIRQMLKETKTYAENVGAGLSRAQDDLGLKIESARRSSEEAKRMARSIESVPPPVEPLRVEQQNTETVEPEPSFPALVSDYLGRIKANQMRGVESDFRTNMLMPTTDGSAPFTFIADLDGSGSGIILPRPRLQRSQEFSSYYRGYYHCNEPSAGEVFIIEPAVVEPQGDGWRLRLMGRMEVR